MSSAVTTRSEGDLTAPKRHRLEDAHRRLRGAVVAYEPLGGREFVGGAAAPVHDAAEMARAQPEA